MNQNDMDPSGKMLDPLDKKNVPSVAGGQEPEKCPVTLDEMEQMLDELAEELPEAFFHELNGGIVLLPQTERHPRGQGGLYTLGCYFSGGEMGRYIAIYYGSFLHVFPGASREEIRRELRKTLRHEFRHHVESLCGENGLEVEDEIFLQNYLRSRGGK